METNPLPAGWHDRDRNETVDWTDPRLEEITRLRLLSDPGFPAWDVSYCHGRLKDGTEVRVSLPLNSLPTFRFKAAIVNHATEDGVYAKGLRIFAAISTLC